MSKGERGRVWVSKQYGAMAPEGELRELEVKTFPEGVESAHVRAGFGLTISLGNYEFARVDAAVTLPCLVEEIPDAFGEAWKLAESELVKQIQELKESRAAQIFLEKNERAKSSNDG